jgi:hypothetical protein
VRSLRGRTTAHDGIVPPRLAHNHLIFSLWTDLDGGNGKSATSTAFTALVTSCCRKADGARRPRVEMAPCKSAS